MYCPDRQLTPEETPLTGYYCPVCGKYYTDWDDVVNSSELTEIEDRKCEVCVDADDILKKYEDDNEMHFHEVERLQWNDLKTKYYDNKRRIRKSTEHY